MSDLVCRRCGNSLEWRTYPTQRGGYDACWHCEQRVKAGLALLPERPVVTLQAIREEAAAERVKVEVSAEAKRERRRVREAARKREQEKRQRSPEWIAHLDTIRPRPRNAEYVRAYWQRKAEQLGLGVA